MNWVKEYYGKIESGEIVACEEVAQQYKRVVKEMELDLSSPFLFYFNEDVGQHAIDFIESFCRHYEGEHAGQLVKLDLWQKAFVQNLFGWLEKHTGLRREREYALEVHSKQGISFLSGCIATYLMLADVKWPVSVSTRQVFTLKLPVI